MQEYASIAGTERLKESLSRINNNNSTIRSNFSGHSKPLTGIPGQTFWHISERVLYVYNTDNIWEAMFSAVAGTTGLTGTPVSLASKEATPSSYGMVRKATNAETVNNSLTNRAVSFKNLYNKSATSGQAGVAKLSTNTPSIDNNTMITPKAAKLLSDALPGIQGYYYNSSQQRGYIRTREGLLIQWGTVYKPRSYSSMVYQGFETNFAVLFCAVVTPRDQISFNANYQEATAIINSVGLSGINVYMARQGDSSESSTMTGHWLAIGI